MNQNTFRSGIEINEQGAYDSIPPHAGIDGQAHSLLQKRERIEQLGESKSHIHNKQTSDHQMIDVEANSSIFIEQNDNKKFNDQELGASSNGSSLISNVSQLNGSCSVQQKNQIATPSTESRSEMKSTSCDFIYSSGGKELHPLHNQHQNQGKGQADQHDINNEQIQEFGLNQTEICLNGSSQNNQVQQYVDFHFQGQHSSTNQDLNGMNERVRRQCRDKTSRYSLTHKGVYTNLKEQQEQVQSKQQTTKQRPLSGDNEKSSDLKQGLSFDEVAAPEEQLQQVKNVKKSHPKSAAECIEIFKNMFAFDWSLKDIQNLRHSPQQELTHSVFWFYVNAFYFPYNALQFTEAPFENLLKTIQQNLIPNHIKEEFKQNENDNSKSVGIQEEELLPENLNIIKSLFKEKRMEKFRKLFKELQERALQESFKQHLPDNESEEQQNFSEILDSESQEAQQLYKFQNMITVLKREVSVIADQNVEQIRQKFEEVRQRYQDALKEDAPKDEQVYRPDDMFLYDQSFLAFIDPSYAKDIKKNYEWYLENQNEILLNVGYPSRQEKDFLKHIEQVQQKKNDLKYKKILKQLEQGKRGNAILNDQKYQNMSMHKRALVTQEDAQCAICNNGDYEDEDLIVFCGNCNIPVHQSCYGIDQLPEGDWLCYNCEIFGFKRGLLATCLLCPKKGGAMKPTNIFTTMEHYRRFNQGSSSKKHSKKKDSTMEIGKATYTDKEDKSLSLQILLKREFDFQSSLRTKDDILEQQISALELHFDQAEKETQLPEDYCFFLQRNEAKIESEYSPQTLTLYHWVHLSCSSWIPGLLVTPKTPVRLNKLDDKRFSLQCIICLKKEGASMQCQASRCQISFHVECARRANYCMEIEREKEKSYKMFCEKHRPLKIVKEMEEKDKQTLDEIQRFCKVIDKCMEVDAKAQLKQKSEKEKETTTKQTPQQKGEPIVKAKKWREKDKKVLFERVKEKYLMFRKMRIYIVRVDPLRKLKKGTSRKRSKKRQNKKQSHHGGCRDGLRSKLPSNVGDNPDLQSELFEMKQEDQVLVEDEEEKVVDFTEEQTHVVEHSDQLYYKFNTPMYQTETDWSITLSRNDFPWNEIKFSNFTSKDCFEKYASIVKDAQTFLKKVLGLKEKYKKMMENQLQGNGQQQVLVPLVGGGNYDSSIYCRCRGQVNSDFFVKCDGDDECINGGWLHPPCTTDLKEMSKDQVDLIEEWYCEDCIQRIKNEDDEEKQGSQNLEQVQSQEDVKDPDQMDLDEPQIKVEEENEDQIEPMEVENLESIQEQGIDSQE